MRLGYQHVWHTSIGTGGSTDSRINPISSCATVYTTNPTWTNLGLKPIPRSNKQTTYGLLIYSRITCGRHTHTVQHLCVCVCVCVYIYIVSCHFHHTQPAYYSLFSWVSADKLPNNALISAMYITFQIPHDYHIISLDAYDLEHRTSQRYFPLFHELSEYWAGKKYSSSEVIRMFITAITTAHHCLTFWPILIISTS